MAKKKTAEKANTQNPPESKADKAVGTSPATDAGESTDDVEAKAEDKHTNPTVQRHLDAKKKRAEAAKKAAKDAKSKSAKADQTKAASEGKKEGKDNRAVFTDDRGLKYRFKKTAPKSLNVDGKSHKITDIIESEEIMLELVYGNSNHIEQIH